MIRGIRLLTRTRIWDSESAVEPRMHEPGVLRGGNRGVVWDTNRLPSVVDACVYHSISLACIVHFMFEPFPCEGVLRLRDFAVSIWELIAARYAIETPSGKIRSQ
jgi:hypothetical protein